MGESGTKGKTCNQVQERVLTHSNKENLCNNDNKSGGPNLSVEPQKMKRSKKGGGYNLRKSLAWDKAFLTEEGVLNDSELSMISGTIGDRDNPSVTYLQGRDSLPMNCGTVCGPADKEILEEDLFKELPSSYPNKRNATSTFMRRDSLIGGSPALVSKKRLLNTGTKTNLTGHSKIPKVPASKKHSCVPPITPIRRAAGGSSLKCTEIAQPVQQSQSSILSSKTKHASGATKLLEPIPKSIKPCADVGNNVTNSTLQMHSLMRHKAQHTSRLSKYSENNSRQDLLTGGEILVKSSDGISSTTALSHVNSDNTGRKNFQGIKPSGLRMPSPSLRFFSETKAPVSNTSAQVKADSTPPNLLKSNIPTSRNPEVARIHDFKPTLLLHGAPNVMGKAGLCSQKSDKCFTSSIVVPEVHAKEIQDDYNQEMVELRVPQGDKNPELTNNKQFRYDNLGGFQKQYNDQVQTSLKIEEKGTKDNNSISTPVEFKEASSEATILFPETRTADRSMSDGLHEFCPEVELNEACETNTEAQSRLIADVELNSSITDHAIIFDPQTNSDSHHNNLMLVSDGDPSRSFVADDRTPGESNSCGLDQTISQRSMEVQLESNLLVDGFSVKLDEDDPDVPGDTGCVLAVEDTISSDWVTEICNANFSVAVGSKNGLVDDEQGNIISDRKLSFIKLSESSEKHDEVIENYDTQKRNSSNFEIHDNNDMCTVSLEFVELSNQSVSTLPEKLNEDFGEVFHLCHSDQGGELSQSSRHGIVDNCASAHEAPTAYHQCTEITEDTYTEVDKQPILNMKLPTKGMMCQSNKADLCSGVLQDSSCHINEGKTNARISDDIVGVSSSSEEVKGQIDLLSCLPNNSNDSTVQISHLEFQSSGIRSKEQIAAANPDTEESFCPVNKNELPPTDVLMNATLEEYTESDKDECSQPPREPRMEISQHIDGLGDESTYSMEGIDDEDTITKKRTDNQKLTRPPPDAVPFSDEWLAAIESAGEEILTMKSGAVKHSPPDKSIPEPGPWSPVKRKSNQVIGPFDCTKYKNI